MTKQEALISFLKKLENKFPPPHNCHHALMYSKYGSDESEFADRLLLQVNTGDLFRLCFIESHDFEKPEEELITEVLEFLSSDIDENEQTARTQQSESSPCETADCSYSVLKREGTSYRYERCGKPLDMTGKEMAIPYCKTHNEFNRTGRHG